jgi:hypothetical protein
VRPVKEMTRVEQAFRNYSATANRSGLYWPTQSLLVGTKGSRCVTNLEQSNLAKSHLELFEVAREYEFVDFQKAIQHVASPRKTGIVLLKSPD